MKKKSIALVLFLLTINLVFSQGIDFKNLKFEEALAQAKAENKLIFIDFHTEWCGPCKKLAKGPFKEPKNGEFYNKNFINLKLDAEKEGIAEAKRYKITSYPTLIFVNSDGNIVHKGIGVTNGYDMIGFGTEALNASSSKYSWAKLQEMFAEKQNDEAFLKLYIQKMEELGTDTSKGIDAWLKVQTEFKESDIQMMNFLLSKQEIYVGSKAEEIFNNNYEHYLTLATDRQKKSLNRFKNAVFLRSARYAQKSQDPELMKVVIERYKTGDYRSKSGDNLTTYTMDYYRFSKNYEAFKRLAEQYIDSLMNQKTIKKIKEEDSKYYQFYSKNKEFGKDSFTDIMLQNYKEGREANNTVKPIIETANHYFDFAQTRKEKRNLEKWVKYCYKLIPEKYSVDNLKADMLYKAGKTKKAIALKAIAIEKMPYTVKKKVNFEHELELMKANKKL
ncbi:thioredoxin family protein [Tenacibaculum aestuarii]|uniref:thioredoxin family protein n=1 Tax=Tenacibaculum aestuarii TaxID=362781 RepID=UPI003895E935